jgi:YhcN/YlaJ family sporulation lipoprotein
MKKSMRASLSIFAGACMITSVLSACAPARTDRAPGQPGTQQGQNMQGNNGPAGNLQGVDPTRNRLDQMGNPIGDQRGNLQGNQQGNQQGNLLGGTQQDVQQQRTGDMQKAENIRKDLNRMREINNASVVVRGDTALVGYKPSPNCQDFNANRRVITDRVRQIDNSIANIRVSESADMMNRIDRLSKDMGTNRDMNPLVDEFNRLFRGINPIT